MDEPWREMLRERRERYGAADALAEDQERKAKRRKRILRAVFWLGVLPAILLAFGAWQSSTWSSGYLQGWRDGKTGVELGQVVTP